MGCVRSMDEKNDTMSEVIHLVVFSLPNVMPYAQRKKTEEPMLANVKNQAKNTHHLEETIR